MAQNPLVQPEYDISRDSRRVRLICEVLKNIFFTEHLRATAFKCSSVTDIHSGVSQSSIFRSFLFLMFFLYATLVAYLSHELRFKYCLGVA